MYGGEICENGKDATHIFTWKTSNEQTSSKVVDFYWLKNCVTQEKIV